MISQTHKRAINMWVSAKLMNSESNPSLVIIEHLTGHVQNLEKIPQNTVQLCQKLNEINKLNVLTDDEIIEIQKYGIKSTENRNGFRRINAKGLWLKWFNWGGYILGVISIIIGGFTWWILGFGIGTWWAHGAAKMAVQKQNQHSGPKWEMPAHIIIHLLAITGLIGFSIYNLVK